MVAIKILLSGGLSNTNRTRNRATFSRIAVFFGFGLLVSLSVLLLDGACPFSIPN